MKSANSNYNGLNGQSRAMLSNISELSLLATGEDECVIELDNYFGTSRIVFADGTVVEVFIQEDSGLDGVYHPAYLALKNSQGKVIQSSLWSREAIDESESDFPLYVPLLEAQYA